MIVLTKREEQWFIPCVVQALGPKSTIAPSTPDDAKVDASNKKKGALYMVSDVSDSQLK